jgi:hypothetical protein
MKTQENPMYSTMIVLRQRTLVIMFCAFVSGLSTTALAVAPFVFA